MASVTVHIIVPTVTKFEAAEPLRHLKEFGVAVTQSHLDFGPASIDSAYDEIIAGPAIIKNAIDAQNAGADAVIIACVGDPAVEAVREKLNIPVFGVGHPAMTMATTLGERFSIIATLPRLKNSFHNQVARYGLTSKFASVQATNLAVLDIEANPETTFQLLLGCARKAVIDDGADVIVLGCAGFKDMDKNIKEGLEKEGHHVQVIDPTPIAVMHAAMCVRLGLSHSKHAYEAPVAKVITGYQLPKLK